MAPAIVTNHPWGKKPAMSWWDIAAGVVVFLGALAALIGSFAQASGDLARYRNFRKDAARRGRNGIRGGALALAADVIQGVAI
jgi:hypothetical protein